jgi:hypothetical protein
VPASDNGVNAWSDATFYTAPSGAAVFSAGTIQWPFAVDNGYNTGFCSCDHNVASTIGRRITSNILDRFSAPSQAPAASLNPGSLGFGPRNVGTTSPPQTATLTNTGSAAMTISSIGITGTNAGDFAQTNNCPLGPNTLAAGTSCTISVTFTPSASGSRSASLSVSDDAPGSPHTVALSGTGVTAAPAVTLSPTTLGFGQQPLGTTSAAQNVTLTNSGSAALTINSIGLTGANAGDFGQTNTCPLSPSTLGIGASCTISATFTPTAVGSRAASVSISDNAAGSPHTVALSGTGTAPGVTLTPTGLGFGNQVVGITSAAQSSTLQNTGNAPLVISSIGITGANAGDFAQLSNCPLSPATLGVGASCTISVTFTPSAGGSRSANVSITDNAPGSPHSVALSGTGVTPAPAVSLSPTSLSFGNQLIGTQSAAQDVTLTNSGSAALTIGSIDLTGTNTGDFAQTNNCPLGPSTLGVGASCTISVTFTPNASGGRSAGIAVTDDAPGSPHTVALSGTGVTPAPAVSLSPASLGFGQQRVGTTSAEQNVTLTNSGTAALTIASIGLTGANAGDFAQVGDCPLGPATLAPGASCTISVTFGPTATGSRTAGLSVTDDAAGSPHAVALSGTGTAPAVALTPPSLNFGNQVIGTTSAAQNATLQNTGSAPLVISSIALTGTDAADFVQLSNCPLSPATLAPGSSCSISVTFTPSAAGSRSAGIAVTDDSAGSPHSVALSGTGVAAAPAVSLSPTSIGFGQQALGTTSPAQNVTLTNSGTAPLTIASIGLTGANAGDFSQTNTCPLSPNTLGAGSSCTISVRFTPSAVGSRTASIAITDDAGGSPHTVGLSGTGTLPIVFDKSLGTKTENVASATMTLTTSAAAVSQARVFLFVNWSHANRTLTSVSGGGLTWTVDAQVKDTSRYHGAIVSANAPAGLAAGTVITATFSGSVTHGLIAAASFTGIASTNPVDRTATTTQRGVVAWSASVTTTNARDLVLGWSGLDRITTSTPAAPNLELHDFSNSNYGEAATSVYRIETAAGAKTVNGTWLTGSGSTANNTTVVAYRSS